MILGGSGSKLVRGELPQLTYENQRDRFRTNMCYENI